MAVFAGPEIVNDGLVFHFDLQNSVKSWKGKPTTNIKNSLNLLGMQGIVLTFIEEDENGWRKHSLSGTWNAGSYPFSFRLPSATITTGQPISARCLLKTNVIEKFAAFGLLYYVNDPSPIKIGTKTLNEIGIDENGYTIFETKVEDHIYDTEYASPTTTQPCYVGSRPTENGIVFNPETDFVWAKEIQMEQNSFCTRYVEGVRLDTASIIDISGNNRTITASNLTYRQDDTPTFDGVDDYLSIPFNEEMNNLGNGSFTFEGVIKFTESGGQYGIFSKNTSFGNGWAVYLRQGPQFNILGYLPDGTPQSPFCGTPSGGITTNTWYHLIYTYDQIKIIGYINGTEVASVNYSGDFRTNTTADSTIGYSAGIAQPNYFPGEIDQIKLYNRALTEAEVKQNFESTRSRYGI